MTTVSPGIRTESAMRFDRLDAIRLFAAAWVAISHGAVQIKGLFNPGLAQQIAAGLQSTFNGESAVMIFFIVSGFCIHLPYARTNRVPILSFLARRYIRIGVPLIAAILICELPIIQNKAALDAVLWSLYAEIIYYTIYPILFYLIKLFNILYVLLFLYFISLIMTLATLEFSHVQQFGVWTCRCRLAFGGFACGASQPRLHLCYTSHPFGLAPPRSCFLFR